MAEANRKEEVNADIAAVWDLITSLEKLFLAAVI